MAIEIVDLPIKNGDFPISYVNVYQRVWFNEYPKILAFLGDCPMLSLRIFSKQKTKTPASNTSTVHCILSIYIYVIYIYISYIIYIYIYDIYIWYIYIWYIYMIYIYIYMIYIYIIYYPLYAWDKLAHGFFAPSLMVTGSLDSVATFCTWIWYPAR